MKKIHYLCTCVATAAKSTLYKTAFLSVSMLALLSATAYANVCPDPSKVICGGLSGCKVEGDPGWKGSSTLPTFTVVDNLFKVTIGMVESGNVVSCHYKVHWNGNPGTAGIAKEFGMATPGEGLWYSSQYMYQCDIASDSKCEFKVSPSIERSGQAPITNRY